MSDSPWAAPLARLNETLAQRAETRPAGSYTTKLMEGGAPAIGAKIEEEAAELIEAASENDAAGRAHFVYEAADLLYHTMVLLAWRGVSLEEVAAELGRREGTSGLVEKQQRSDRNA
jgi:phosphoribosyl-ATP pyrophosphohydrolase